MKQATVTLPFHLRLRKVSLMSVTPDQRPRSTAVNVLAIKFQMSLLNQNEEQMQHIKWSSS